MMDDLIWFQFAWYAMISKGQTTKFINFCFLKQIIIAINKGAEYLCSPKQIHNTAVNSGVHTHSCGFETLS